MVKTNLLPANGYFRFTRNVNRLIDLDNWFGWFQKRDIPCCIVKHKKMYSLWRAGEESNVPEWDQRAREERKREQITPEMVIIKTYKWEAIDGERKE